MKNNESVVIKDNIRQPNINPIPNKYGEITLDKVISMSRELITIQVYLS